MYMYAAVLGGISALYAASLAFEIYFHHCIQDGHKIAKLTENKVPLMVKFILSAVGISVGVGFMIYLISWGIVTKARFDSPLYMGAIQAWMTFKWSLSWMMHLVQYHRLVITNPTIQEEQTPFIQH